MSEGIAEKIARQMAALPASLKPAYKTLAVNETIPLYHDPLLIKQNGSELQAEGFVEWTWLPRPSVTFRYPIRWDPGDVQESFMAHFQTALGEVELGLTAASGAMVRKAQICASSTVSDGHGEVRGNIQKVEIGAGLDLTRLDFHVPNFPDFNGDPVRNQEGNGYRRCRATTIVNDWRIILDGIEGSEKIVNQAKRVKGYVITHVGSLNRVDGAQFAADDTQDIISCLRLFLSFCRGSWTAPILLAGHDGSDAIRWQNWSSMQISPWPAVQSWFSSLTADGIKALPGFSARSQDPIWEEPIRHATHWYVEANRCAGGIEGSIILTQAALELLSWTLLVAERRTISASSFDKKSAADKIGMVLDALGVPKTIPPSLRDLTTAATAASWNNGPEAIAAIRNRLIHPSPKNRNELRSATVEVRADAWSLGLWFLELSILSLCQYAGKYSNRLLRDVYRGEEVQDVPWAT